MKLYFNRPQRSCEGYIFTPVCHSVHRGGGAIPACIAGGIPACLAAGLGRGGIPACLAGFQAHTQGGSLGGSARGGLQAHSQGGSWGGSSPSPQPRGKLRGIWTRPTAKGEVEGDLPGGGCLLQGGTCSGGVVPAPGGCLLWGDVKTPQQTATVAEGTHPTGMHSCFVNGIFF